MTRTTKLLAGSALFALTAVAIAPTQAQAQGLEVSVSGFYNTLVIARDQDEPGSRADEPREYDINSRGRYALGASYQLDNGLTVGFQSQHEMQENFETDRSYVFLRGGFGQLQVGNHSAVGLQMGVAAVSAGWGIDDASYTNRIVTPNATSADTVYTVAYGIGDVDYDKNPGINYFTPRMGGFQFGVSFKPDNLNGSDSARVVTDEVDLAGDVMEDIVSVAANYSNSFGGLDLEASLATEFASVADENVGTLNDDYMSYAGGVVMGSGPVEGSVSYAYRNQAIEDADRHDFAVGLTYAAGPWTFGPTVGYVLEDGVQAADVEEELLLVELGANYAMGPGINLRASGLYADWSSDLGGDREGDGLGVGAGLALSF